MRFWITQPLILTAILATGCAPLPRQTPVETLAADALGVGEPFTYLVEPEPVDVGAAGSTLTLEQCLKLSLRHDPRIQPALARLRQAEADARQTRLLPNPVIGVAMRFPTGGGKSIIDADVSAELLSLLTLHGRVSAVDSRLRRTSSDALAVVLDVALDVQRQYANVQASGESVAVAESRRAILRQLVTVTDARLNAGEGTRLDSLSAASALATLDLELASVRSQDRIARLGLARLIGEPSGAADWTLAPFEALDMPLLSEQQWIALALEHRPEIAAIRWELAALGQEVRLAKLEPWAGGIGAAAERDESWSVGPSASVALPTFDNGSIALTRREAMVTEQKHELTRITRQIVEDVRVSLERVRTADEILNHHQSNLVPLQEQKLKQAQDGFRLGLGDVLLLRLAEQDFQLARSRVIELQTQRLIAGFELDRAVGGRGNYADATTPTSTAPTEN